MPEPVSAGDSSRVKPAVLGFDRADTARAYDLARPSYPAEAVAHIVGHGGIGPGRRVLDLGAGTGKLTRLLVPTGAEVVAVEPVPAMRKQLALAAPTVEVHDGTAETVPLPDGSVDVVTVAQAFHWFDAPVALAEIRRVLRPGGWLFLVWNMRDRSVDWVLEFGDAIAADDTRPYDSYYTVDHAAIVAEAGGFEAAETWYHGWEQPCDEDLLVTRAESVSVVGTALEHDRVAVLTRVRELARSHPDLAGRPWFGFPYTTGVWRCRALSPRS
jgi:ubiquinone/menaquinone biosynthesis C-methylase UbiE